MRRGLSVLVAWPLALVAIAGVLLTLVLMQATMHAAGVALWLRRAA